MQQSRRKLLGMMWNTYDELRAQLTRDLFAIAKFLFFKLAKFYAQFDRPPLITGLPYRSYLVIGASVLKGNSLLSR